MAFAMGTGDLTELMRVPANVNGTERVLGYPLYFPTILRHLEDPWNYSHPDAAVSPLCASHAATGDFGAYAFHVFVPLLLAAVTLVSWVLRPASRTLATVFPNDRPADLAGV